MSIVKIEWQPEPVRRVPRVDLGRDMGSIPNTHEAGIPRTSAEMVLAAGESKPGKPLNVDRWAVSMTAIRVLVDMARADPDITTAMNIRTDGAFGEGFTMLLIDPANSSLPTAELEAAGIKLTHWNTPTSKDAHQRFMAEALMYKWLLHLFVLKAPSDPVDWFIKTQELPRPEVRAQAMLPQSVQPLEAETGTLFYEKDDAGNRYFVYESAERRPGTRSPLFVYMVYVDPRRPFPTPMTVSEFANMYPSLLRQMPQILSGNGVECAGGCINAMSRLMSPFGQHSFMDEYGEVDMIPASDFWALKMLHLERGEVHMNLFEANHALAFPTPVYTMRPLKELAAASTDSDYLGFAQSMLEAGYQNRSDVEKESFMSGARFMRRFIRDPVASGATGADGLTKKQRVRLRYGRSDPTDDYQLLREDVQLAQAAVPQADPEMLNQWELRAQMMTCKLLGVPVADLQSGRVAGAMASEPASTGMAKQDKRKGTGAAGAMSRIKEEVADMGRAREDLFHATRIEINSILNWVYPRTLGLFDLAKINTNLDALSDLERRNLAFMTSSRRGQVPIESRRGRRRLIGAAFGVVGDGAGKKRKLDEMDPATPAPTLAELREVIVSRMYSADPLDAIFVFSSDVKAEATKALVQPHEQLDQNVFDRRFQVAQLLGDWAGKGHVTSFGTAQKYLKQLGVEDVEPPPAEEFDLLKKPEKEPPKKKKKK
jgi:hypothetical protein